MATAINTQLSAEKKTPLKIAASIAIILGIAALVSPFVAGIAATYLLAANFVIGGNLMIVAAFRADGWIGALGLMILGAVCIVAGFLILAYPLIGLATITLACIAGMFVAGVARVGWAFKLSFGTGRYLLLASGVLSIAVAAMLYSSFPFSAQWMFGVLVGLNLLVEGAALLAFVQDKV